MSFAVVSLCIAWLTIKKNIKYHLPLLNRWTPPTAAAAERHPPPPPVRLPRPCASSHDPVPPPTQPFAPALEAVGASGCATRGDEGERKGEKLGFRLESSRDSDRRRIRFFAVPVLNRKEFRGISPHRRARASRTSTASSRRTPPRKHWICIEDKFRAAGDYVSQKSSSVFGKKKVEPMVKDAAAPGKGGRLKMESSNAQPQDSAYSVPKNPSMTCCRKRTDGATFLEDLKDHIEEFIHASMDEHKTCFKHHPKGQMCKHSDTALLCSFCILDILMMKHFLCFMFRISDVWDVKGCRGAFGGCQGS
uniref:Expressed protein n=4 Tax=Oryza sativa TaxID=4530 RepID=Q94GN2_ORYSJ|nr:hypothetical protein [Oryza sativa Japonica Group]ABF98836.1 expressed protein [Oryza sativa Japonica Group]